MFELMMRGIEEQVTATLFRLTDPEIRKARRVGARAGMPVSQEDPLAQFGEYTYVASDKQQDRSFASYDTSRFALAGQKDAAQPSGEMQQAERPRQQPIRVAPQTKPNDPCPCGSGRKYKKCHGGMAQN